MRPLNELDRWMYLKSKEIEAENLATIPDENQVTGPAARLSGRAWVMIIVVAVTMVGLIVAANVL